ncbi:restriction endonuclease subunit S [Streptomyces sp. GESEQ-4]|uniref:restriction endonuclease subunit S n=1 Tax=Streptomyces sp. GESEQ-4 TaxID=2812655 RepID=UPI001B324725|nr:restriction endonuclease subunit S [Streptomyces sp. GESEQ-4]
MSEWPIVRLESLGAAEKRAFSMGPFGSALTARDYVDDGVPLVRGVNLGRSLFYDGGFVYITDRKADEFPGANLSAGDLVLAHRGTIGQVSMIPKDSKHPRYVLSSSLVRARLNPSIAVPEFYYYWLRSPAGQREILQHVSTVGVPGLVQPVTTVKSFRVPRPSLDEQQAIAQMLGALDGKIAVNERIAATVDELCEALFVQLVKSVNAQGELKLGDVAAVNTHQVKPSSDGSLRYVDISSVGVGFYEWPALTPWDEAPGRARRKARVGDVIWSTVRPNRRSHALVMDDDPHLVFSTGLAVLSPVQVGPAFLYEAARTAAFQTYLESVAEGSAYPAVRAEKFKEAPIPYVPDETRVRFESTAMHLRQRAHSAAVESRALAALRDTLLPQLMSGKIRVRDAEKTVEEAV